MNGQKTIRRALISVFHKDGLEPIVRKLNDLGVIIYSTGGTQSFIEDLGVQVIPVEELTTYPSILGGRVKTLHPKVFGGILGRRELDEDVAQLEQYDIPPLDLVIVDLYPFEETVDSGADHDDIIEKIDIGGISLIRAAAKNYSDVLIIPSMNHYDRFTTILDAQKGATDLEQRRAFARDAFSISSHYDTQIFHYMSGKDAKLLKISELENESLRYGENPHQNGTFHGDLDKMFDQLHGKALSYNNLLDIDAGIQLMNEFRDDDPTFAILKHNNACGISTRPSLSEAYEAALAADPTSAFGGVLIANRSIDAATANRINSLFCEVVIAPAFDDEALATLQSKKNRVLLRQKMFDLPNKQVRTALNGYLEQEADRQMEKVADLEIRTKAQASPEELEDLIFANKLAKHTKSNTIVFAKDKQLCASGTGQTSRVDACRQAIEKAGRFNLSLKGAAMASDAFFPFPDCVELADKAGITAVIQPGGSIKDQLSIDYCDEHGLSMYFSGKRHFKH
ncbi:MAG: phosphoribosylaminoimidazolecarboxamide formyltransferase/IMP cyclohydrolase [Flavobacteriales bacterium]|jgi:phosphoribosylaminoimidazolecarboxamide formyltransferase/IMP cyclohydrolase